MTETPNQTRTRRTAEQCALLAEIARTEKAYAVAHNSRPALAGPFGKMLDDQAAAATRLAAEAEIAVAKLDKLMSGSHPRMA